MVPQSREPTNSPCLRLDMAEAEYSHRMGRRMGGCAGRTIRSHTYWRSRDKSSSGITSVILNGAPPPPVTSGRSPDRRSADSGSAN